ncbi:MAG: permease-like cell division protein FtsX [Chitinophagales bacterium]
MRLRSAKYFVQEASIQLTRNRLLSIATATTVAVCVFVLGLALLIFLNAGRIMTTLESNVEIVAYLKQDLPPYQRGELRDRIEAMPDVKSVTYVSREQALASLEKRMGQGEYDLSETIEGSNPLPESFRIKAYNPQRVPVLARSINKLPGVEKIRYGQELVAKLFAVTRWVRVISMFTVICLALAAVFLVATTIRLGIFSRKKEIYIMKLVGATDWFVRLPFFIEGTLLALFGTALAVLFLSLGYHYLLQNLQVAMAFIPMVSEPRTLLNMYLALTAAGICLGIIGTYISVNKYLKV